ncbi:MAG: hypothetical protein HC843_06325 [Sphingomonadales bacterium]|nr:hypothetical protein [Sphingomonadales bacterium]
MTDFDQNTDLPANISFRALLGLAEPVGMDSDFVRSIQTRSLRDRSFLRVAINLFFAVVALALYRETAPMWATIGWLIILSASTLIPSTNLIAMRPSRANIMANLIFCYSRFMLV